MYRLITRDKNYYHDLLYLAIPVALRNLVTFLITFADNLMVNSLGDVAVSGVYIGSQLQIFLQLFTMGFADALVILGAMYWGKKDYSTIKKYIGIGFRFALYVGTAVAFVCFIAPEFIIRFFTKDTAVIDSGAVYLRYVCISFIFFSVTQILIAAGKCIETPKVGFYVSLASLGVNLVLNYILIFGKLGFPAMGIKGAAIATLIARIVEMVCAAVFLLLIEKKLKLKPSDLLSGSGLLKKDFIKYGLPLVAGEVIWAINMLANSAIMGQYGKEAIAAVSVTNMMNTMVRIVFAGIASSIGIIASKTVGAGQYDKLKEYAKTTQVLFLGIGILLGLFVYFVRIPFVGMYRGISEQAAAQALLLTAVLAVSTIGTSYQFPCLYMVKSSGDINFVFRNDTIFVFLVVLPSALIAYHFGAPPWLTFACLKCDQVLKCFVAVVKVNRFNWIKDLTRNE